LEAAGRTNGARLPVLQPARGEVHVWVDDTRGETEFVSVAELALVSRSNLRVAVDAEWQDPRPVSVLQLALSWDDAPPTVFLLDLVCELSETTLYWCRCLLSPDAHQVLAFSCREDMRRLCQIGLLPSDGEADLRWLDLQHRFSPASGLQPGLQAVVAGALGFWMDKSLQTSNWDQRPLSAAQKAYAALDASVLLRLHRCDMSQLPGQLASLSKPQGQATCNIPDLAAGEEKDRWDWYRAQPMRKRHRKLGGGARDRNDDLCFLLPAALTRLMRKLRGLGLDTEIVREGTPQRDLVEAAETDDRIIIYHSTKNLLPARVAHRTYMLRSSTPDEQLREVIEAFDVEVDSDCLCGRCVQCNAWDWQLVGREAVRGNPQVPNKTLENFDEFWLCGGCGKIYWEGKMFVKALDHFRSFMPDGPTDASIPGPQPGSGKEIAQRSQELEALGWSPHRVRAAMVRDGYLTAEKALDESAAGLQAARSAAPTPASKVAACGRQSSRPVLAVLPALCLFAGGSGNMNTPSAARPLRPRGLSWALQGRPGHQIAGCRSLPSWIQGVL